MARFVNREPIEPITNKNSRSTIQGLRCLYAGIGGLSGLAGLLSGHGSLGRPPLLTSRGVLSAPSLKAAYCSKAKQNVFPEPVHGRLEKKVFLQVMLWK